MKIDMEYEGYLISYENGDFVVREDSNFIAGGFSTVEDAEEYINARKESRDKLSDKETEYYTKIYDPKYIFQEVTGLVIKPAGIQYDENSYIVTNGVRSYKDLKDKVSKFNQEPRNITGIVARCFKNDSEGAWYVSFHKEV